MAVGIFLLILIMLAVAVAGGLFLVSHFSDDATGARRKIRDANSMAVAAKSREKIAVAALRHIANGCGPDALEAQIALDEIDQSYDKELTT